MGKSWKGSWVLGIWDGHDAGAALLNGNQIVFAVNEERFSRRKLEAGFPQKSIAACLKYAHISPADVTDVAASTSDPAKTLTRIFPGLKEEYYLLRRRIKGPRRLDGLKKRFKYRFTELKPNVLSTGLSKFHLVKQLNRMGFKNHTFHLINHHVSHAQAAARCSGFAKCLVVTLDGVGDGQSGSIQVFENDRLRILKKIPSSASLGIFFEHVTNLMNMRELEDEGKVMALANYAYPIKDSDNPLMDFMRCRDLGFESRYRSGRLYKEMKKILWRYPSEQFAYMAQRVVEKKVGDLIQNALNRTGIKKLAVAGGLFSNVKLNMKLAGLADIENYYVFPNMGDGGLGLGAAVAVNYLKHKISGSRLKTLYLGPDFSRREIVDALEHKNVPYRPIKDVAGSAAELILKGEIILWFQGRAEFGPRALGNRSILARADNRQIKDRLNLILKKRVWYQPFCPSMLVEEASELLHTEAQNVGDNLSMTTAFRVRKKHLKELEGVISIDGTCRPHFVGDENPPFRELLLLVQKGSGRGVVLNTSFNLHGEPMVCSPADALDTLKGSGFRYLFLEDFLVEKRPQ